MSIEKYFEIIDDCIHYVDDGKKPYTADQTIKNSYNTILGEGLYTESSKMWSKKLSSEKTWSEFKNIFAEVYHDLHKLQCIKGTQAGFCESNMNITRHEDISKVLDNLAMATTSENYLLNQITITIQNMEETNKILMEKIKTLTATNEQLTAYSGHQKGHGRQVTTGNEY